MNARIRILLIEDNKNTCSYISALLDKNGYTTTTALTGREGLSLAASLCPNLILLDLGLPDMDGFQVLEQLRGWSHVPILIVSACNEEQEKVAALDLGADDYIVKPFEIAELLARVETVLRRYHKTENRIVVGDVVVDTQSRVVTRGGKIIPLTAKEYNLLILFLQNKNIALFRETIYERVWENEYMGDSRTVDLHVQRLRKKLGWQERIAAVYKVGYRLEVAE